MKRLLCLVIAVLITVSLTACGGGNENSASANSAGSDESVPQFFTIGNLTVAEISQKLKATVLENGYTVSVKEENLDAQSPYLMFSIIDASGAEAAVINSYSDLERKASDFSISWNYTDNDDNENTALIAVAKTLIIAMWPDYTDDGMKIVEETVLFTSDEINKIKDTNTMLCASGYEGYISLGMSLGRITFAIRYPNVVENV